MALRGEAVTASLPSGLIAASIVAASLTASLVAAADPPRAFIVADLSDKSDVGVDLTIGRSRCDECVVPIDTTSTIVFTYADFAIRAGLKSWISLPVVFRDSSAGEFSEATSHTALGQMTVGIRQMWDVLGDWRPRLSLGASFSSTPRFGAGGQAGLTLGAAKIISGRHPSHFSVETTTSRLHGDLAARRGPAFAQLGLAVLARSPDRRDLRAEFAFEVLVGALLADRFAVTAELTASVLDRSVLCSNSCADDINGFTHQVSGNLGARVVLGRFTLGARLIVPLIDSPEPFVGGIDQESDSAQPSVSLDALAHF